MPFELVALHLPVAGAFPVSWAFAASLRFVPVEAVEGMCVVHACT